MEKIIMRCHNPSRIALTLGFTLFLILILLATSFSFQMLPMNLQEMASNSARIVVGVCTAREESEMASGSGGQPLRFTKYTFTVTEVIKGNIGQTLTIRQVRLGGRPMPGGPGKNNSGIEQPLDFNPIPLPEYQPGQEILLFLGEDSTLGLTSPVAMDQAVFDVETSLGQKFLKHRFANRFLFRGMSAQQLAQSKQLSPAELALFSVKEKEQIPYTPFISLIRKLATGN